MKKITTYLTLFFIATTLFGSFKSTAQDSLNTANNTEFELLVKHLETNGDFINSNLVPTLILATEVKENLKNKKYLILDVRSEGWFDYGHIKNAKNIKAAELLDHFKNNIDPSKYDKITIVCFSGQSAAYYTSLLRLYGYNNVYSLKWGMAVWADDFATNTWVKNSKKDFSDKLETIENTMPEKGKFPTLNTGKTTGKEILKVRIKEAFAKPYKEFIVKVDSVFNNPNDFYIVNYVNEEKHNFGHVKGAVLYNQGTLSSTTNLYTIPTNKNVLVSCTTGQKAAYVVAYLHILGYDVSNLAYGANSYMNTILVEKDWNGFTKKEIKNYPVIE